MKALLEEAKGTTCLDCGLDYPPFVLQFDHVEGEKKFTLSVDQAQRRSLRAVREEIAKCEVVCSNCHLIRTHEATSFDDGTASGGWVKGR